MKRAATSLLTGAVLGAANAWVYVRHTRQIRIFRGRVGYYPNVARPSRYNEMMLWRKIMDHNPAFVTFSDKLATKRYVAQRCPELALAAVLWSGDDAAAIPADLPRPCIIKANHASGWNYVVGGDTVIDVDVLTRWVRRTYGQAYLEWAYADVDHALLAEALITARNGDLIDLSVHVVGGAAMFIEVVRANKTPSARKAYFRPDGTRWAAIERKGRPTLSADYRLPPCYIEALDHARELGRGVDYLRIDFLVADDRLYGGEITVYPGSGLTRHADFLTYNAVLADHWDLSTSWFLTTGQRGLRRVYADALRRAMR